MIRHSILFSVMVLIAVPAVSAEMEDVMGGVYVPESECRALTAGEDPEGITRLNAKGFESIEWSCDFVRLDRDDFLRGWVATLMCQEPGHIYPDMAAIQLNAPGRFKVSLLSDEITVRQGGTAAFNEDFVSCPAAQ